MHPEGKLYFNQVHYQKITIWGISIPSVHLFYGVKQSKQYTYFPIILCLNFFHYYYYVKPTVLDL